MVLPKYDESTLPKWAQEVLAFERAHADALNRRVRELEAMIPWTEPDMEWFTVLNEGGAPEGFTLFRLLRERAQPMCAIGPGDRLFVGRAKR